MWRKRFIKFWLFVVAMATMVTSTTIFTCAAVAKNIDSKEMIEELTEAINEGREEVVTVFSYSSAEVEVEEFSEIETMAVECETIPTSVSELVFATTPVSISEEDIVELLLVKKEEAQEEIVEEIAPVVERVDYASQLSNADSTVTMTVGDDDYQKITLIEELENGTRIYDFKGGTYTIPANLKKREPKVSENGYVEKITEVPHYLQQSYPYTNYGGYGTVSSHGCGITSCAMVYSYLLDYAIKPDELAQKYGGYNTAVGSCYTLFPDSAEDFGLEVKVSYSWNEVEEALKRGCVVIANVQSDTIFTSGGHFIVYYGITDDGKILINDPNVYNYGEWSASALKEGFENGFDQKYCKYSFPCWIYEPKDVEKISN